MVDKWIELAETVGILCFGLYVVRGLSPRSYPIRELNPNTTLAF
jgi:hypothetical protein